MMQSKQKPVYVALGCVLLLSGVALLIDVRAQKPQQAQIAFTSMDSFPSSGICS